jgi:RHS repeat-associated protein
VLEEWTGTGGAPTLTRYYNYGLGLISQQDTALYYFVPDGHGSVRLLLTTVGTVANVLAYDAYGILISSNSSPQTVYLYCGEQFDSNLGFYYLRARYYSHVTGRFRTVDTIEQDMERPLTMSKYLYCSDNSLNRTDPSGLKDYELKLIYAPDRDNDYGFFDPLTYGGAFLMVSLTDNQIIVSNIKFTDNIADRTRAVVGPMHLVPGRDRITVIVIAGHGSPGDIGCPVQSLTADLSWGGLGPLTSTNTPQKRFAAYLKPYTQGHCTVYLDACNQADNQAGRDFMQILAISLGATVIGYEGTFFVTGFGDRWTATPTGVSKSEPVSSYQRFGEAMSENWIPF